jgi:hypothetical protein
MNNPAEVVPQSQAAATKQRISKRIDLWTIQWDLDAATSYCKELLDGHTKNELRIAFASRTGREYEVEGAKRNSLAASWRSISVLDSFGTQPVPPIRNQKPIPEDVKCDEEKLGQALLARARAALKSINRETQRLEGFITLSNHKGRKPITFYRVPQAYKDDEKALLVITVARDSASPAGSDGSAVAHPH